MAIETMTIPDWKRTTRGLGWAGLVPFLTLPVTQILYSPDWLETLLIVYAQLILAFLCGTLWMKQIQSDQPDSGRLLASNIILLVIWPSVLLPTHWASLVLAIGFSLHLAIDSPWRTTAVPCWYRRLRLVLSSSAITLLALTALIGFGRVF